MKLKRELKLSEFKLREVLSEEFLWISWEPFRGFLSESPTLDIFSGACNEQWLLRIQPASTLRLPGVTNGK